MFLLNLAVIGLISALLGQAQQPNDPTKFNIEIRFTTPVSNEARASFVSAVNRWQEVIVGDIGGVVTIQQGQRICGQPPAAQAIPIDDLLIFAAIEPIDGRGAVLGSAGPCGFAGGKVRLGSMRFDEADVNQLITQGRFTSTVLHEIGHIIGVGADWGRQGLVTPTAQGTPFLYLGENGAVGQSQIGGSGRPIVEDVGGAGTARAHWKESVYSNELMTGFISGQTQPMSLLTVQSLKDLGYQVDVTKADAFAINGSPPATKAPTSANANTKAPTNTPPTKTPTKTPTKAPTNNNDAQFNIQVIFTSSVSTAQRAAFDNAVARWQQVIVGDIGNTVSVRAGTRICGQTLQQNLLIDDIVIFADISPIDGAGRILGQAGPCGFDNGGRVRLGNMQFDDADANELIRQNRFEATILHEMGHVLGIGTVWEGRNLVSRGNPPFTYEGANGIQGQRDIGGQGKPIVEDTGGPGTARGHWKETVYQNELMTGFISGNSQPMSRLTVQALKDIGYTVDVTKADNFNLNSAGRRLRDLKAKSDLDALNDDLEVGKRVLEERTEWEKGYPGEIVYDLPTQDKELTEDGEVKTDWETGFEGEVFDFDAQGVDAGAIAGGVIAALAVVGAAAAFVVMRRRKSAEISQQKQMTSQNPMFGSQANQQQQYPAPPMTAYNYPQGQQQQYNYGQQY